MGRACCSGPTAQVNEKQVEAPAYYVIHSWKMGFRALVDTLRAHFSLARASEDDVVIWIDFFCINQHKCVLMPPLRGISKGFNGGPPAKSG